MCVCDLCSLGVDPPSLCDDRFPPVVKLRALEKAVFRTDATLLRPSWFSANDRSVAPLAFLALPVTETSEQRRSRERVILRFARVSSAFLGVRDYRCVP